MFEWGFRGCRMVILQPRGGKFCDITMKILQPRGGCKIGGFRGFFEWVG